MCRAELSALIAWQCLSVHEVGVSKRRVTEDLVSLFPCCHVNFECQVKKKTRQKRKHIYVSKGSVGMTKISLNHSDLETVDH